MTQAAGAHHLGAVLGRRRTRRVDVGRRQALAGLHRRRALAKRFAEKHQRRAGAVADGRLGDDDRHRQEALAVEQPLGGVERAVLRVSEEVLVLFLRGHRAGEGERRRASEPRQDAGVTRAVAAPRESLGIAFPVAPGIEGRAAACGVALDFVGTEHAVALAELEGVGRAVAGAHAACSPVMLGSRVAAAATAASPPPAICTVGKANLMPFASNAFLIRAKALRRMPNCVARPRHHLHAHLDGEVAELLDALHLERLEDLSLYSGSSASSWPIFFTSFLAFSRSLS